MLGIIHRAVGIQKGRPALVNDGTGLALHHGGGGDPIARMDRLGGGPGGLPHPHGRKLDIQHVVGVLRGAQHHIHILHQGDHNAPAFLHRPELSPVIQVAGYGNPQLFRRFQRLQGSFGAALAQGGRDAREMEPIGVCEDRRLRLGHGGTGPVIDHVGGPQGRALLQIIQAQPLSAPHHVAGIHAPVAQRVAGRLAQRVFRQPCDVFRLAAHLRQRDQHVRLAAGIHGVKARRLDQPLISRRREAHQHFPKGNNCITHPYFPPMLLPEPPLR